MLNRVINRFNKTNKEMGVFNGNKYPIYDHFVNDFGENIPLFEGLRDKLRPDWKDMVNHTPKEDLRERKITGNIKKFNNLKKYFDSFNLSFQDKRGLEIGCHVGAATYCMSKFGLSKITGSDMSKYYLDYKQTTAVNDEAIKNQFIKLNAERSSLRSYIFDNNIPLKTSNVDFVEDDICNSKLPSDSYDLICSFAVLEHVLDPLRTFQETYRILSKGGVAFHQYNPFFCLEGGHSLCTLDIPWGHVRLNDKEFKNYLHKYREEEEALDYCFYKKSVNRMTISDMMKHIQMSGFSVLDIATWRENYYQDLLDNPDIIKQSKRHYNITTDDLLSNNIWILLRKP